MMITFRKIEAGEYASVDGRFTAARVYTRIIGGNRWELRDHTVEGDRGRYGEPTLAGCKALAEKILADERGERSRYADLDFSKII